MNCIYDILVNPDELLPCLKNDKRLRLKVQIESTLSVQGVRLLTR